MTWWTISTRRVISADRLHGDMSQGIARPGDAEVPQVGPRIPGRHGHRCARQLTWRTCRWFFNYDLPYDAEDYLHRIGRNGARRGPHRARYFRLRPAASCFRFTTSSAFTKVKMHHGRPPTQAEVDEAARRMFFVDKLRTTLPKRQLQTSRSSGGAIVGGGILRARIFASALLHQLQGGEAATAAKVTREAMPAGTRADCVPPRREREERAPQTVVCRGICSVTQNHGRAAERESAAAAGSSGSPGKKPAATRNSSGHGAGLPQPPLPFKTDAACHDNSRPLPLPRRRSHSSRPSCSKD